MKTCLGSDPSVWPADPTFSALCAFADLLNVFSAALLPEAFRFLVLDPSSPIIDFYNTTFDIDAAKSKPEWQHIALLDFVGTGPPLNSCASPPKPQTVLFLPRNNLGFLRDPAF